MAKRLQGPMASLKPRVYMPVLHLHPALLCLTIPWPVSACWLHSLVWRPKNTTISCWWYSESWSMWTAWYGCGINLALYLIVCLPAKIALKLAGLLSVKIFLLVKLISLDRIGTHTSHTMKTRLFSETKIYLQSIRTALWLGYLTRLVMPFRWMPL